MALPISHALVLPDKNFEQWLEAARPYLNAFTRVAVVRSPAGNDLNRFRNVTAVQTPRVWYNEDALLHIRRVYPMVVRADIIRAQTPAELTAALQTRIAANDRYGEKQTTPKHIFDRFVLEWPSATRPARITRPFSTPTDEKPDTHEGIDITASPGVSITAGAAGTITKIVSTSDALGYGAYTQITTVLEGQTYITTYAGLKDITVSLNQPVKVGDKIAVAAGDTLKLIVQNPPGGTSGFRLPNVVDPTPMIYWQGLRVRPSVGILRIRSLPGLHGDIVGTVTSSDLLETEEMHGRTLEKLGVEEKWLKINYPGVNRAYCAAWYLEGYGFYDPAEGFPGINLPGMNLDLDHSLGTPEATPLKNLGWVRLLFNVSLNPNYPAGDSRRYGNTDVNFTYNRYLPIIQRYANAGIKVILIFTHQTFGEGQGYVWPTMDSGKWRDLTGKFVNTVRQVVTKFAGKNLIFAYQIWNEQDTPLAQAQAAVPIPPTDYAYLLSETIKTIRSVDTQTKIITGGHMSGPGPGTDYARATLAAMPGEIRPDGIAFHPYGCGPVGNRFSIFGSISNAVLQFSRIMPGKPVWITEWGVLDRQGDDSLAGQITQYATGFLSVIKTEFPGQVACACWYAWADSMHNGYGLVTAANQPRQPLYDTFLKG